MIIDRKGKHLYAICYERSIVYYTVLGPCVKWSIVPAGLRISQLLSGVLWDADVIRLGIG